MERTFYFPVAVRHSALGVRVVFAIDFRNLAVLVFLAACTFYDISVFQANFLAGSHTEKFLRSIFHKVFPFDPQLAAEFDRMATCRQIFRIVDRLHLFHLPFRIIGDNEFNRVQHGRYTGCTSIEVFADGTFQ